ncbi:hypothetical protein [Dyella telluris]|uniref:Energy transducer TonB n=1 Tax=Dyella telluris TaxID=2763498 RepID=A0A7G8Q8G3_9GAMM|nr:hypothetical protein [Dyella telluris]QNK03071.1 hypothetical protein H8F01_08160 [Dyella telluris]
MSVAALCVAAILSTRGVMADDLRHQAEASLLVQGKAVVNPDGKIASYSLREPDKLPAPVIDLIRQNVTAWTLVFTYAPAAPVEEQMTMRIIATEADDKHTTLRLASASFEETNRPANESVRSRDRMPPTYPKSVLDAHVSGTVYVLARVGRDGHVLDAAAEQVNLHQYTEQYTQGLYRKALGAAAARAIKQWTFDVPVAGPTAGRDFWYVRIPCRFHLHDSRDPSFDSHTGDTYGSWEIYLRGPRETIPWVQDPSLLAEAPDATPDGGIHQLGAGPSLQAAPAPN